MLKSKIHRATLTGTELDYEGSITIDQDLLASADIFPDEQVNVPDLSQGAGLGPRGTRHRSLRRGWGSSGGNR